MATHRSRCSGLIVSKRGSSAVLVEEATSVDRDGDLQPVVDPRDDARQVAAPADPGDADPVAVDLLARGQDACPRSTAATAW